MNSKDLETANQLKADIDKLKKMVKVTEDVIIAMCSGEVGKCYITVELQNHKTSAIAGKKEKKIIRQLYEKALRKLKKKLKKKELLFEEL